MYVPHVSSSWFRNPSACRVSRGSDDATNELSGRFLLLLLNAIASNGMEIVANMGGKLNQIAFYMGEGFKDDPDLLGNFSASTRRLVIRTR